METIDKVKIAVDALSEKKGEDIKVLDISEVAVFADYFIIATGKNVPQIKTMVDFVEEKLGKEGVVHKNLEGYSTANWVLMDYGDFIVHIFDSENRLFYDLERIWRDGKSVEL